VFVIIAGQLKPTLALVVRLNGIVTRKRIGYAVNAGQSYSTTPNGTPSTAQNVLTKKKKKCASWLDTTAEFTGE
jgi:hypothetical protein